jgi:hypothetical protein
MSFRLCEVIPRTKDPLERVITGTPAKIDSIPKPLEWQTTHQQSFKRLFEDCP